ncbi:hypothetical protein STEG23_012586 [Scotinomys teguina]
MWVHYARLLEACLHSLLSFLTSNFPSNPLLPDSPFSIERLSLRPVASSCTISCCAQVLRAAYLHRRAAGIAHQPYWPKSKRQRTPRRPARGSHDAQREDPTTPSARTPPCPARGPHDAQRKDPTTPSARTPAFTTCIVPPFWIWNHGSTSFDDVQMSRKRDLHDFLKTKTLFPAFDVQMSRKRDLHDFLKTKTLFPAFDVQMSRKRNLHEVLDTSPLTFDDAQMSRKENMMFQKQNSIFSL